MSNRRGEIIIGAMVVMMVAMMTMMFAAMPIMHGGHQRCGDNPGVRNDSRFTEAIPPAHECGKEEPLVPLQEKPSPAL